MGQVKRWVLYAGHPERFDRYDFRTATQTGIDLLHNDVKRRINTSAPVPPPPQGNVEQQLVMQINVTSFLLRYVANYCPDITFNGCLRWRHDTVPSMVYSDGSLWFSSSPIIWWKINFNSEYHMQPLGLKRESSPTVLFNVVPALNFYSLSYFSVLAIC
jgi:hypothetical protein